MSTVRVLIADSSDIVLEGLTSILNDSRSIKVVATARTSDAAMKLMAKERPDVCLISTSLRGFEPLSFMKKVRSRNPEERVILMMESADISYINRLLKCGVDGCITRSVEKEKLRQLLMRAARGEKVFSKRISSLITRNYADMVSRSGDDSGSPSLTPREREVLQFIVDGYTSQEIATFLFISPRTVETHRFNLLQKLNLRNTAGLVRYALEHEEIKGDS